MPLRYLFDENFAGEVWQAVHRHNARNADPLDVLRVGDAPELPKGSRDPDILLWCETNGRVLVSYDKKTLPRHLTAHLSAGRHLPGIILFRRHASEEREWNDRAEYLD